MKNYPLLIPGVSTSDGRTEIFAPYDRSVIATADTADKEAVEKALVNAYRLFRNRDSWLKPARRIEILDKAAQIMASRAESLALEAAREGGKPLIDSRVEVIRAIDGVKCCIETLRTEGGKEIPMNLNASSSGKIAVTRKEPLGVVVAVSAFNHPLNLIVHQVGPAIATGCPVIVKPAGDTPISCFNFVNILYEAGLPQEWCQALVIKDHRLATALITDSRVGFFSFIGSASVGWTLRSKLAPGTRCALEHGGVAPVIVAEDVDLNQVVPPLTKGGLYHAGQVCVSVQRVFVHESIARELANRLAEAAKPLKVGDPTLAETDIGPLIRPAEVDRIEQWVDEAIKEGAELLTGGKRISNTCYESTILYNPHQDSKVSKLEVFGPVICVYPYQKMDDAIAQANSLPDAFQASVFTKNIDTAMRAYYRLDASAVMINEHTAFRVDWMPFAGLKHSGLAVGGIPYTMHDMQIEKMLVLKSSELP
ncbi:aldehyde dehydrogenase family protein [Deltaproteobacteria bacterium TL4]